MSVSNKVNMDRYRDCDIAWIGKLPPHWRVVKLKQVATFHNGDRGLNYPTRADILCEGVPFITSRNICDSKLKLDISDMKYISEEHFNSLSGGKLKINDLIFCMRGSVGICAINRSLEKGFIASTLVLIRAEGIVPQFLQYVMQARYISHQTQRALHGSCSANISAEQLSRYAILLPPIEEQQQIADFLDHETYKIDILKPALEEQCRLLKRYRQTLISNTVMRGLNGAVPLRDSGIDWLGAIPRAWKLGKLKNVVQFVTGYSFDSAQFSDSGIPVIRIGDILPNIERSMVNLPDFLPEMEPHKLFYGDIVMAMTGATIGKVGWYLHPNPALINQRVCAFRARKILKQSYLYYILQSEYFNRLIKFYSAGSAQENIGTTQIEKFHLPLPPIDEQEKIADHLDVETTKIDEIIHKNRLLLKMVSRYREALISSVVVGKMSVET